jgi:hypothetical protein
MQKTSSMAENAAESIEKVAENLSSVILAVMEKLAGTESDIKLSFEDLTLEAGMIKAKLNGAVVLSLTYASEPKKESSTK